MNDQELVLATVQYYAQEGHYHHMQAALLGLLKRFGSDPMLLFWRGFSMILEGRIIDGIRELSSLQDTPELLLCVPLVLKYAHKKCQTVDQEAVKKLDDSMKSTKASLTSKDFYYAGVAMWLLGREDRARDYLDKVLKASPKDREALSIRGWVDLTSNNETLSKKSINYFEEALNKEASPPLHAILGKARFFFKRYSYTPALDILNTFSSKIPTFLPFLIEKIEVQLAQLDWDGAVETAQRCLILDSTCIHAISFLALEKCVHKGNMEEVAGLLGDLIIQLDKSEPKAHHLYHSMAQMFGRIAYGHKLILQQSKTLIDRALTLSPSNQEYLTEQGYQYLYAGEFGQSLQCFKKCLSFDQTSTDSSIGIVYCLFQKGQMKSAFQQLEFLTEVAKAKGQSAGVHYLNALLAKHKGMDSNRVIQILNRSVEIHFAEVKGYPLGRKYFTLINPDFIMKITQCMMEYAPSDPSSALSDSSRSLLQSAAKVLDPLTHAAPGLLYAQLMLAKVKYLSGDFSSALSVSQVCIYGSYRVVESLLLQAVIHLNQSNHKLCAQSLEAALSSNFEVQQYPLYHLVKGRQKLYSGNFKESLYSLQMSLSLKEAKQPEGALLPPPSTSEWVSGYLSLADVMNKLQMKHEAAKVMQDAIDLFSGTPDEARLTTANAELLISRGNTKEAIEVLKMVTEDKPYYIQAMERMAEVYLNHEKNKQKYIACYKELAEKLPGPPTAQLLGDAYMNIQELDQAIDVFETAIKKSPKDGILASKIGQAYLKSHNYAKAITYYEASLKSNDIFSLRYELACVYLRLKHYDRAERTVLKGLEREPETSANKSPQVLREDVQYYLLLTKIYKLSERLDDAMTSLEQARDIQIQLVKRTSSELSDMAEKEKLTLAQVLLQLAQQFEGMSEKTEECYKQILELDEANSEVRTLLARHYLSLGMVEESEEQCVSLLQKNKTDSESATLLMAELLVHKDNFEGAAKHLEDVLIKKPDHYDSLIRLIDLKRRLGDLTNAKHYIAKAESCCAHSAYEPKLKYCKGLYHRYMGQTEEALVLFNQLRKDPLLGEDAIFSMIEICLNLNEVIGAESLKTSENDPHSEDAELMAMKTAEKLLKEMKPSKPASLMQLKVLECFVLLSSKSRPTAERVLASIQELPAQDREKPPVLLVSATAFIVLKQLPRARNQLKRIGKMPWLSTYAEELERGWILLADVYIQSGKYDLAAEQLLKCLKYNRSCTKASEYLGFISEKEHAYQDAAKHYENAWRHSQMTSPAVGYRLAFNFLKAHRYLEAVEVCHQVLGKHPAYPRIKKDILEKARQFIRNKSSS